jgi:hypothetical protein
MIMDQEIHRTATPRACRIRPHLSPPHHRQKTLKQHDGSSTMRVTRQQHRGHATTRQRAPLAGIGGEDGCGWIIPQQQNTTQPEDHMNTSCDPHWQDRNLCWKNACRYSKEAATQRRKRGCTIVRWPSKHDNCGDRVYQHKGS